MFKNMTRHSDGNKESSSGEVEQKATQESLKLRYDIYKHLTTLCTGSILLLISFLDKIFAKPVWKGFVIAALCLFLLSILASLVVMHILAGAVRYMDASNKHEKVNAAVIAAALVSFVLGILALIFFAVKNLYT
ncbi:MAG: hypothetical protein M3362_01395 [Acidobacteriota bacterium]|nr:hypothetical protein [Acidobacteriota bacterium]